jgi:hypothetical protein
MPLKKKHTTRNAVILWAMILTLAALMVVSFAPARHMTEIVLFG